MDMIMVTVGTLMVFIALRELFSLLKAFFEYTGVKGKEKYTISTSKLKAEPTKKNYLRVSAEMELDGELRTVCFYHLFTREKYEAVRTIDAVEIVLYSKDAANGYTVCLTDYYRQSIQSAMIGLGMAIGVLGLLYLIADMVG